MRKICAACLLQPEGPCCPRIANITTETDDDSSMRCRFRQYISIAIPLRHLRPSPSLPEEASALTNDARQHSILAKRSSETSHPRKTKERDSAWRPSAAYYCRSPSLDEVSRSRWRATRLSLHCQACRYLPIATRNCPRDKCATAPARSSNISRTGCEANIGVIDRCGAYSAPHFCNLATVTSPRRSTAPHTLHSSRNGWTSTDWTTAEHRLPHRIVRG